MVRNKTTTRNILTRSLAMIALFCIYCFGLIGTSAVVLGASTTSALARGGRGGGFRGGGFRGGGFGFGGPYYGYAYPPAYYGGSYYDEGACYLVRRRVMTPYGWRVRRVRVCS